MNFREIDEKIENIVQVVPELGARFLANSSNQEDVDAVSKKVRIGCHAVLIFGGSWLQLATWGDMDDAIDCIANTLIWRWCFAFFLKYDKSKELRKVSWELDNEQRVFRRNVSAVVLTICLPIWFWSENIIHYGSNITWNYLHKLHDDSWSKLLDSVSKKVWNMLSSLSEKPSEQWA